MTSESLQRGTRAKKEAYILAVISSEDRIKVTDLYGAFSKKFPGSAIRTFLSEYLPALEYRGEIVLSIEATGYFAYTHEKFEKMNQGGISR